jgi:ubiquinone/menaquinone biosynthesis C-methylase UbiE
LALRPFRIWEYAWLFKALSLGNGGVKILDLGGPATHLTILAALAGCSVTSVDLNPEFVRSAQECADALSLLSFSSRVGDMRDLSDFPDESFDVVLSCSVLEHLTAKDQETALEEMARVVKRGGLIGLTFDYGPPAPGANEYLPPPHDPPRSAAEATRRYVRGGLELVGNPFVEDPAPGALFLSESIRYTVASFFLAKPPVPGIRFPRCERQGSSLDSLVISKLPSRIHASVARTTALLDSIHTDGEGESRLDVSAGHYNGKGLGAAHIIELERVAEERLNGLNSMHTQMEDLRREADARERGLHELTSVIAARDARIVELERMAEERLSSLNTVHQHLEALRGESGARERGLHELTAVIAARDARIAELERVAEERLSSLNAVHEHLEAVRGEADARERGLHELTAVIAARDARIAELERAGEEQFSRLNSMQTQLEAVRSEADARETALHERTSVIAARDARIAELERVAQDRLTAVSQVQTKLTEAIALQEVLSTQVLALEHETLVKYLTRRIRKLRVG